MKYLVPLYSATNVYAGEEKEKIGNIIVESKREKVVELFSGNEVFAYIKADQEQKHNDIVGYVFPQPDNSRKIEENINNYNYSLYIKGDNLDKEHELTKESLKYYKNNPEEYIYNKKRQEMVTIDASKEEIKKVEETLQKKI